MSDISHSDELVTKQDLSSFYQGILPYLGGMPDILANKFSHADLYSTDEKMIGRWIDGKPVYQKTSSCGALPNNTTKTVNHNISNLDYIIEWTGTASKSTGIHIKFPYVNIFTLGKSFNVWIDKTDIGLETGSDLRDYTKSYVTLQYTKTTDSAVNMGDENDYSTTEKIIGTWVDGKPIYQKTFSTTSPVCTTNGTEVTKDVSIGANVDTIVDVKGTLINSTGATHILPAVISSTVQSNTKIPQIKVNGRTNNASSDKNKVRISNSYADFSNLPMYITVQYTKV